MWIHANIKCQCRTPLGIHIHCHRTASGVCHLPLTLCSQLQIVPLPFCSHSSGQETEWNQWQQYSAIDIYQDTPSQSFTCNTYKIKQETLINSHCQVLHLPHLCNVSIIWFPIVIHTSCSLLLSIKPLSLLNTFMGVPLQVYACQMFSASSAETRPLDSGQGASCRSRSRTCLASGMDRPSSASTASSKRDKECPFLSTTGDIILHHHIVQVLEQISDQFLVEVAE